MRKSKRKREETQENVGDVCIVTAKKRNKRRHKQQKRGKIIEEFDHVAE